MSTYQVLARKYRPKKFEEVVGQEAIVITLKNAIKSKRLAHAYLFCGSRGTGKTTLARLFAKALNCMSPNSDGEPCNLCNSCKEITNGHSLDVLEIDGASHRGIDDIRQINENVGYATAGGSYKIYIIDEVHMLTKEAFNALLKTLEEPPERVKFFFATTEPHKVLPTILSRCQRFQLNRIPLALIIQKLQSIAQEMGIPCEAEALHIIAKKSEGGLRDAESLLDQVFSFHEGEVTTSVVNDIFGLLPKDLFFEIDNAAAANQLASAFQIAHTVSLTGKDVGQFVGGLIEHYRNLLIVKTCGIHAPFLEISEHERKTYEQSAQLYSIDQCQKLIEYLISSQEQLRHQLSERIALEAILLHVISIHSRISPGQLIQRLAALEKSAGSKGHTPLPPSPPLALPPTPEKIAHNTSQTKPIPIPHPTTQTASLKHTVQEDPSPSLADLGAKKSPPPPPPTVSAATAVQVPAEIQRKIDTVLQFAAVEFDGRIEK